MTGGGRRAGDHDHADAGFTVVELLVAMIIFGSILGVAGGAVLSVTRATVSAARTSTQLDQARAITNLLERQVRSASAINRPATSGSNVYLEFEQDVAGQQACVQWVLRRSTGTLAMRIWATGENGNHTPSQWRTFATNVVNTPAQEPFTFSPAGESAAHQRLGILLRQSSDGAPVTTSELTMSARNTSEYSSTNADLDGDGLSDSQVCQDFADVRP